MTSTQIADLIARTSVIIPTLNEEETVARVVHAALRTHPQEVIVIDADSEDDTVAVAQRAGATVMNWRAALPDIEPWPGKGESLWRGTAVASGEIIVFIDADLKEVQPDIVQQLVIPFADPQIALVKATYNRGFGTEATGGGRVTELSAKPILAALFPELKQIQQPLGGEYALRTKVAKNMPFVAGYGVEIGLLLDVAQQHGVDAIAQVELADRYHRNRPLSELAPMAQEVINTALARARERSALPHDIFPGVGEVRQRPPLSSL